MYDRARGGVARHTISNCPCEPREDYDVLSQFAARLGTASVDTFLKDIHVSEEVKNRLDRSRLKVLSASQAGVMMPEGRASKYCVLVLMKDKPGGGSGLSELKTPS